MSAVHVIQKKVNWTNKQAIIVTQTPGKSRRTSNETSVGKKRKRRKEAEEDRTYSENRLIAITYPRLLITLFPPMSAVPYNSH